jgi:MoxR-like ATPase
MYIKVDYPSGAEEWQIARMITSGGQKPIQAIFSPEQVIDGQELVQRMPVCDQVVGYAWAVVRASRPNTEEATDFVNKWVNWGAGPRGVIALISCAKARALLNGRYHASIQDVQAVMAPALRHRLAPNYAAIAAGVDSDKLIELLVDAVPADKTYEPVGV